MSDPLKQLNPELASALERLRPITGQRPSLAQEIEPHPLSLLKPPVPVKPQFRDVVGGSFYDAITGLINSYPQQASRVKSVGLRNLPEGVVGQMGSLDSFDFEVDPKQATKFGAAPLSVLKHELAHILGYDEDVAQSVHPPLKLK